MINSDFVANYSLREVGSVMTQNVCRREFRASPGLGLAPRVQIVVIPDSDESRRWVGEFYGHNDGSDLIAHTPDPECLLAVAGGVAYWVPVATPEVFHVLGFGPVRAVHSFPTGDEIILESYSRLACVDRAGDFRWVSTCLVSSVFDEVRPTASVVVARGFSAPDQGEVEMTLDRTTGQLISRG